MNTSINKSSLAESDETVIRAELNRLLSDRRFSGARQMSAFLRYIVCETLAGNGSRIKAYTVGVDALGKPDDFDAQGDPSVRVLALRLRKTLAAAYEGNQECGARIVLRVGTYVPEFYKPEAFAEPEVKPRLQSPDHASVVEPLSKVGDENAEREVSNRGSDTYRQATVTGMRVDSVGYSSSLNQRLPKNSAAFTRADIALPDIRNHLMAVVVLLALALAILNPVKADVRTGEQIAQEQAMQMEVLNRGESVSHFLQNLD